MLDYEGATWKARAEAAEANLVEVESACGMPLGMIAVTLDAHRATSNADAKRIQTLEAKLAEAERELELAHHARREAQLAEVAVEAREKTLREGLNLAIEAIDRIEPNRHSPWCNGVHEAAMCEGDYLMANFMKRLRALAAGKEGVVKLRVTAREGSRYGCPGPWMWMRWRFARSYVIARPGALCYNAGVRFICLGGSFWFQLGILAAGKEK